MPKPTTPTPDAADAPADAPVPKDRIDRAIEMVLKYGIAGAIAAFLVYGLEQDIKAKVENLDSAMKTHQIVSEQIRDSLTNLNEWQRIQADIARANCVNSAKDAAERNSCWKAGGVR